jgi:nitrite reductase (NADH) small subunit
MSEIKLGSITQIPPGEGREFTVNGIKLAVFHLRDGSVHATQAECPHRQGPLADGLTGNGIVVCPFHSWKFELATGLPVFGECAIQTYHARLENAEIVVTL